MHRRSFLTRALGTLSAIRAGALGRYVGAGVTAMPTAVPKLAFPTQSFVALGEGALGLGLGRDSVATSSGGFLAPSSYSYFAETFDAAAQSRPVREAVALRRERRAALEQRRTPAPPA